MGLQGEDAEREQMQGWGCIFIYSLYSKILGKLHAGGRGTGPPQMLSPGPAPSREDTEPWEMEKIPEGSGGTSREAAHGEAPVTTSVRLFVCF